MLYYNRIRVTEHLLAFTTLSHLKAQTNWLCMVNKEIANASPAITIDFETGDDGSAQG